MDESRKLYEKWAIEVMQFTPDELVWDERRNCYRDYVPHMAWKGWQASREAIEIELHSHTEFEIEHMIQPEEDGYSKGWIDGRNYGEKQIRAAGIKVKE